MLAAFLEEAAGLEASSTVAEDATRESSSSTKDASSIVATKTIKLDSNKAVPTKLLLTACNDWEGMTSKDATGIDDPHEVVLFNISTEGKEAEKENILKTFSSSSAQHMFILAQSGNVYSMGKNEYGQCGSGGNVLPIINGPGAVQKKAAAVAAAKAAPKKGGQEANAPLVHGWPVLVPLPLPLSRLSVKKISTGKSHSMLLTTVGSLWACGNNEFGQLGLGHTPKQSTTFSTFTQVGGFDGSASSSSTTSTAIIVDVACGFDYTIACTAKGALYSWGHPEYGQLGHGTTGAYMKEGGKGAAVQFNYVTRPQQIQTFVQKDSHDKLVSSYNAAQVNICQVACGKNHSICLENWIDDDETASASASATSFKRNCNRVFSFGFGGYGRLGHGSGITADEAIPREVTVFSQSLSSVITDKNGRQQTITMSVKPVNNQKQIRTIVCGSSFTLCVSMTGLLYHWGKMNSAKGGESTMYPKFLPDTQTMTCSSRLAAGNNAVIVGFNDCAIAWGAPPAGKFGLEGGARSSTIPKYISCIDDMHVMDVSAGYGHVCYVVKERTEEGQQVSPSAESLALTARFNSFPMLSNPNISITATANSGSSSGKTENGKRKRAN